MYAHMSCDMRTLTAAVSSFILRLLTIRLRVSSCRNIKLDVCVYILTYYWSMCYWSSHDDSCQKEGLAGFRYAEHASGRRPIRAVQNGFLRSMGSRSGQIRDVARPFGRWRSCGGGVSSVRLQPGKLLSDSASFPRARVYVLPSGKARPQGACKTQGRGARICFREEEGESRYGSGSIGCFDQTALRHRHSSDDRHAGDEKKTAFAGRRASEKSSSQATIPYRRSMRTCAARHSRMWSRLHGRWSEFASMVWRACFQALRKTSRSSSTPRALLVLPGAGRGTCTGRDYIKFMNSSFRR